MTFFFLFLNNIFYLLSILLLMDNTIHFWQVKQCAEMSRKLRFFKDQINKAGIMSSSHTALQPEIDLEDLEVSMSLFFGVYVCV